VKNGGQKKKGIIHTSGSVKVNWGRVRKKRLKKKSGLSRQGEKNPTISLRIQQTARIDKVLNQGIVGGNKG